MDAVLQKVSARCKAFINTSFSLMVVFKMFHTLKVLNFEIQRLLFCVVFVHIVKFDKC